MPRFAPRHCPRRSVRCAGLAGVAWLGSAGASLGVCGALLGGCGYNENGRAASLDQVTLRSTTTQPKTATLIDTRDGETIWSYDIPVGKKVTVRFYDTNIFDDEFAYRPAVMKWTELDWGDPWGLLDNEVAAPPPSARRFEWSLRSSPELPPEAAPPSLEPLPEPAGPVDGGADRFESDADDAMGDAAMGVEGGEMNGDEMNGDGMDGGGMDGGGMMDEGGEGMGDEAEIDLPI